MNEDLFKKTFSRLTASDDAKSEIMDLTERRRRFALRRPLALAAAAAALCAMTVTAVAAGEYLGNWHETRSQWGDTPQVTDGTDVGFIVPDDTPEDMTDNQVRLPALTYKESVTVEEGRVILRLSVYRTTETILEVEEDITDALAASPDGAYHYVNQGTREDPDPSDRELDVVDWSFDFLVKPGWESPEAQAAGDGSGYVISGTRYAHFAWNDGSGHGSTGTISDDQDNWNQSGGVWTSASEDVPQTWSRTN